MPERQVKNFCPVFRAPRITVPIPLIQNPSRAARSSTSNPFSKGRLRSNIDVHPGSGSSGNPNRRASIFESPANKRLKTQSTSRQRKAIDLTTDDTEPIFRSSTAAEDSDDSLNLGNRITNDGHATRRLKTQRRDVESPKVARSDTEPDPIEDFPEIKTNEKPRKVSNMIRQYENRNSGGHPKLALKPGNPLPPQKPKRSVRLFFTKAEER